VWEQAVGRYFSASDARLAGSAGEQQAAEVVVLDEREVLAS
jgi:hypothetical protein